MRPIGECTSLKYTIAHLSPFRRSAQDPVIPRAVFHAVSLHCRMALCSIETTAAPGTYEAGVKAARLVGETARTDCLTVSKPATAAIGRSGGQTAGLASGVTLRIARPEFN